MAIKRIIKILFFLIALSNFRIGQGNHPTIKLSSIFGDNMVLQRDKPIKFWGTATAGSQFSVQFADQTKSVKVDATGNWLVVFPEQKTGVFELKIIGSESYSYKNILMGDVWLTSGQSNMEYIFGNTDSIAQDMVENSNIRYISVPYGLSNYPQKDFNKVDWQFCTKENSSHFSAVAYYFAQKINNETGVPIGIVNTAWGGTSVKAWTSEKGIANIPEYKVLLDTFLGRRNTRNAIDSINVRNYYAIDNTNKKIMAADKGYAKKLQNGSKSDETWSPVELPGTWANNKLNDFRGVVWLRREIQLPVDFRADNLFVQYGRILGVSEMYINGIKVGSNNYNKNNNRFFLKPTILVPGKNIFVIRVAYTDTSYIFQPGSGNMVIQSKSMEHPFDMSIAGQWEYATTLTAKEIADMTIKTEVAPPNTTVTSIFNYKISPLTQLPIKGFLWYQGENDAPVGFFYRTLFKNMITDWRQQFNQGNLPFLFVQLPVYGRIKTDPVDNNSDWAVIRESQAEALSLPNTAMAVPLELGNPDDIHPHNKKPIGERLANAALKMLYGFKDALQSPLFKSFKIKGNEVHLFFTNVGSGLAVRNGDVLKGFAIAGADKNFVLADVKIISKDEIVVSAPSIKEPASVRYAWKNSPVEANLINNEGLPAAPFRTDDWQLFTFGKVDN